jgi:hypothetical protein
MKKITKYFALIIIIICLTACFRIDKYYEVTGRVLLNGEPLQGASVRLSFTEMVGVGVNTDSCGVFKINLSKDNSLQQGRCEIRISKSLSPLTYIVKYDSMEVYRDYNVGDVNIEKLVDLLGSSYGSSSADGGIKLWWTNYDGLEFKKYEIYRKYEFETEYRKIHTVTARLDTIYEDRGAYPLFINTYRVDIYNDSTKVGESNYLSYFYQPNDAMGY